MDTMTGQYDKYLQDIAIKRNHISNARGCLGEPASLGECEDYENHISALIDILTHILDREIGTVHGGRHTR